MSERYPVGEAVFFRSFFAIAPLLVWLWLRGDVGEAVRTHNLRGHFKRSLIGSVGMFTGFTALSLLPLPDAVAISYVTPLLVVVLAALILKEKVRAYRWIAVSVGFVGVLVMLTPHWTAATLSAGFMTGSAFGVSVALFAALCSAAATIEIRTLTRSENTGAIVFYFMSWTSLLALVTIPFGWVVPDLKDGLVLIGIGVLGGLGQILLTESYRHGDASLIAPFEYSTMLWALLLGWFVFAEWPAAAVLAGAAIVIASSAYVLWREQKLGLLRPETQSATPPPQSV